MSTKFAYSAANNLFYSYSRENVYRAYGSWPDDAIDVADDIFSEFTGVPPEGKQRVARTDGLPAWGDATPSTLSADQILQSNAAERDRLLRACTDAAFPLQSAVALGIATAEQQTLLAELQQYAIDLTNPEIVDLTASPMTLPTPPAALQR